MEQNDLNKPMQADNAEESVKCPNCGGMFAVGMISGADGMVNCPFCLQTNKLAEMQMLGASNEGY